MPRLTPADKEVIRAMIAADAKRDQDESEQFAVIFRAVLKRHGIEHAARLEEIAMYVNMRREQQAKQAE